MKEKSKNHSHLSRRTFLSGLSRVTSTAAAVTIVPRSVLGGSGHRPPSDRLNIACVGVGGQGREDAQGVATENIVALCDVDDERAAESFRRFPKARRYRDFRVMLEKEKDIDAVTVSTPDHTHAVAAMAAMELGKHVYCQKPLARSLAEVRAMGEAARRHGVATQMGIQGHCRDGLRRLREWIEAGAIGTIREVHYWTNRPIWPQAIKRPLEQFHSPPTLDWDLWLGPASERPYHPGYAPFKWRGWWDFGTGALGDMGCHGLDAAYWILDLPLPSRIVAETTPVFAETAPAASRVTYYFPARGLRPEIKVVWRDGGLRPIRPQQLEEGREIPPGGHSGQFFVGDKGVLAADIYGENPTLIPNSAHQKLVAAPPAPKYSKSPGIYQEWIRACKGGKPASASFEYAVPLTTIVLLGNLAVRTGEAIEWDPASFRVTNKSLPNQYLHEEYRKGWSL